jgi:hypothetical protein
MENENIDINDSVNDIGKGVIGGKGKGVLFTEFYSKYPRKVAKKDAIKAFNKLAITGDLFSKIMLALEKAINSSDWKKDNGQFIPYPATWLNGGRWEDETITNSTSKASNIGNFEQRDYTDADYTGMYEPVEET